MLKKIFIFATLAVMPAFCQTRLTIDRPSASVLAFSGSVTFYGWSVDDVNAISGVTVSIDGNALVAAAYGAARADVCAALPGRAGCPNVGWTFALDTTSLVNGSHVLTVTATSTAGAQATLSQQFIVINTAAPLVKVIDKWTVTNSSFFTLSATPTQAPDVYLNGLLMDNPGDYTLAGTVITFSATLSPGDGIKANYFTNGN